METEESPVPTPRYSKVVKGSVQVASDMGHSYVGVEHLFLAVIPLIVAFGIALALRAGRAPADGGSAQYPYTRS